MKLIFLIILLIFLIIPLVTADNITVITPNPSPSIPLITTPTEIPTGYVPTPTLVPTSTPTPVPTISNVPYISQGQTVYVNDTIDISGVVPPYPELAWWNGYDMYDANASYIITLPSNKYGWYNFYLDPSVFTTRTGNWYKYADKFEPNGNNLAFVVMPQSMKNSTMRYNNGTLINISEQIINNYNNIEIPIEPPVEIKHISDYLLAIGDPFDISVTNKTNIWLFGRVDQLLDYKSTNSTTINISEDIFAGFEPGTYTIMLQTVGNKTTDFTVMYDNTANLIKWFDPVSFTIKYISTLGLSPQVTLQKFQQVIPDTIDSFKTYTFALQSPYVEIQSIGELVTPNWTINEAGTTEYYTNVTYIEVKGYTNVAIGSILKFIVDEPRQTSRTIQSYTSTAVVGGSNNPGDMRWFDAVIPIDKYNLPVGPHTVTAYTNLSNAGTVYTFNIYIMPPNSFVQPTQIRYIAGEHGSQEFIPTPTPVIQTVTQIVTVPVTIMIPVTPSDEQVKAQQKIIADENLKDWGIRIVVSIIIVGIMWYLISLYLRRKELGD